jgi:hypothetical protein
MDQVLVVSQAPPIHMGRYKHYDPMTCFVEQHREEWFDASPYQPPWESGGIQECVEQTVLPMSFLPDCIWEKCTDALALLISGVLV